MLSRVADSLYWMSRYMERADGILRMLKINYASSQDDPHDFSWAPVLEIFTYLEDEQYAVIGNDSRTVLQYMVTDKENPNSVLNIVTKARENARSVQDHITKERPFHESEHPFACGAIFLQNICSRDVRGH